MTTHAQGTLGKRKGWIALAVALGLIIAGYFAWSATRNTSAIRTAPAFDLAAPDGKKVSSSDFSDQTTVIHFWASWCAPCLPELPEILGAAAKLQKDSEGRPIRWILISVDETWEKARSVLDPARLPPNAVALLDPDSKIAETFGTFQYPETYVLTRQREVAAKWIGPQEWSAAWGTDALKGIETISRTQQVPAAAGAAGAR